MGEIRRMVVKVGTATITDRAGRMSRGKAGRLVAQVMEARTRGVELALVSSGAIASGVSRMKLQERPREIEALQAVAAVGQGVLINMYAELFGDSGVPVGQVLLTQADMNHRKQYLNARRTIEQLFKMGAVPVINENDTVATEEITFGENDLLAALVAALLRADVLLLLTDTAGLYTADPRRCDDARLLDTVELITPDIECLAGETGSELASGGMSSKVQAAKVAVSSGVPAVIADGRRRTVIADVIDGKRVGTYFAARQRIASRKHWIGYAMESRGCLLVDDGAAAAITQKGKSLLPAGVVGVEGVFKIGDSVEIIAPDGRLLGRGLAGYDAAEADRIKGLRSGRIREMLGERGEPMVHRDSLVVFEAGATGGAAGERRGAGGR